LTDIRPLGPADLDLICYHRLAMFRSAGWPEPVVAELAGPFRAWLEPRLADGRYFGWAIEAEGQPIAGIGMIEIDWPPHPRHPAEARRGYILNVYVEPEWRRRGLARRLMERAREEGQRRGIAYMVLHAAEAGRPLYEQLGWTATNEMGLALDPPPEPGD
jgi:ribosomal protein S18 acetylase RimI-like enzyme